MSEQVRDRVLVTGATGFLGRTIAAALEHADIPVLRGRRSATQDTPNTQRWVNYGDIGPDTQWGPALQGAGTVVHLAGIAHAAGDGDAEFERRLDQVIVQGSERLARSAARHGVRRFVYMSSALVHGTASGAEPIAEGDPPRPANGYAHCKLAAEQSLEQIAAAAGMELVILRPPMVYGPNARGNFARLVKLVRSGLPLPLGRATAPRSFIGIDNLADATVACVGQPAAAGGTFLVADRELSSTADLIDKIAAALGRRAHNMRVPPSLVRGLSLALGREGDFHRLFAPFALNAAHITARIGWQPPLTMAEGIARAIAGRAEGRADQQR